MSKLSPTVPVSQLWDWIPEKIDWASLGHTAPEIRSEMEAHVNVGFTVSALTTFISSFCTNTFNQLLQKKKNHMRQMCKVITTYSIIYFSY